MPTRKVAIAFDEDLYHQLKHYAAVGGMSISAWLADAALHKLHVARFAEIVDEYEAKFAHAKKDTKRDKFGRQRESAKDVALRPVS